MTFNDTHVIVSHMTETATQSEVSGADDAPRSPWLTLREAADISRRHYQTVWQAAAKGDLRSTQQCAGGRRVVHKDDLEAWMRGERPTGRRRGPRAA